MLVRAVLLWVLRLERTFPAKMPISIEMSAIGGPETQTAIEDVFRNVLGPLAGDWQASVIGSQQNDIWELKIRGPKTDRRYKLYGTDGQHDPRFIRELLMESFAPPSAPSISLPIPVSDSWIRLSNSSGTAADVHKTLNFISENWSRSSDDFSVERKWRAISPIEESRLRLALEEETRAHLQEFEKLVRGVTQGPVVLEFYNSLSGLPTTLKHVAYVKGFRNASEENRVLVLFSLSKESQNFIETCVPEFPGDLLVETFRSFLRAPKSALKLRNQGLEDLRGLSRVEVLFGVASLRVSDQNRYIGELSAEARRALHGIANRLIKTLPNEYFGRFARLRLSVFVCLSAPEKGDADNTMLILKSERDPVVVDVVTLTEGMSAVVSTLAELAIPSGEQHPTYAAALVDSVRANAPEELGGMINKLEAWSKSKFALLAVASEAALLKVQRVSEKDFEKTFLKAARSQRDGVVAEWLANNVDFLKCINIARLPKGVWKSLFNSFLQDQPHLADALLQAKLDAPDADRYWQDGIEVLTKIDTPKSERLLTDMILREVQRGSELEMRRRLSTDPVRSHIQHRFWTLAKSLEEGNRIRLFDAIQKKVRPTDVAQLLQTVFQGNHVYPTLIPWIKDEFVPYALRTGALDTDFGKGLTDVAFKESLAERLGAILFADWQYLERFPDMWKSLRQDAKTQLLAHVRGGLHAALLNTRNNAALHGSMNRLSVSLDQWAERDTPVLEPEFSLALSLESSVSIPEEKGILEAYFRRQPRHPHDLALFLGANPWALNYLFHESGNWPSKDILFESLCKSFVFVANLRARAQQNAQKITNSVLLDAGVTIRAILVDIETDIAGYFVFRDVLEEMGLKAVAPRLGAAIKKGDPFGAEYRIVREAGRPGRLRVFSHGLKVGEKVVDTAAVTQSGVEDDRD